MKLLFFLIVVIGIKMILTKGIALLSILLSFFIKGKFLHNSEFQWNAYILSLDEPFVIKYSVIVYIISSFVSSCICYLLLNAFDCPCALLFTISLMLLSGIVTWRRFHHKLKSEIIEKFYRIKKDLKRERCLDVDIR